MSDLYDSARELAATTGINWLTWDIRVVLVDVGYVFDAATHDFLDDVGAGTRVATSGALTGKSATDGVCDANDVTFSSLTGDDVTGIVIYHHTGTESTSDLLCYYDRYATGALIDFSPGDVDATVRWYDGATKMFKL